MKNNIVIVFSSHRSEEENQKFINHIGQTIGAKHKVVCYPNFNQFGLAEIYNQAIREHSEKNCIFVMCHNDIKIKTRNWGRVLLSKFNNSDFGIIGVAGSTFVPASGQWWEDRSKMYGIVEHTNGVSEWISEYCNEIRGIQPVVMIDGLFMTFDPEKVTKGFNEDYGKFHFYDLPFCVDNYLDGCDVGVITQIRILHESVGQTDEGWEENRKKFAKEYQLPIRHVSEDKLRVLICCQFFKNYTGSEVSNYELSRELVKQGCDVTLISSMVGEPLLSKAKKNGVKVYGFNNLPNHRMDGEGQFKFVKNEKEFDIIHINHRPIGELILQLYPNTPAVMHVRSEVIPTFEEPIVNPVVKRYISIRETITDYIKTFGVKDEQIVTIDNPFDATRFNTDYKQVKNKKEVILFIGTLDHLRKDILFDLSKQAKDEDKMLWIIGADSGGYAKDLANLAEGNQHVRYFGIKSNVEDYIKMCDYTAGIFKGRTTIEGFLCGKPGWIYEVDKDGKVLNKVLTQVPDDVEKYHCDFSAKKVFNLYNEVIDETWL